VAAASAGTKVPHGEAPPAIRGGIAKYARAYRITYDQLKVAMRSPHDYKPRQQRGRPKKVSKAQEHFVENAIEARAMADQSVTPKVLAGMLGAVAAANSTPYTSTGGSAAVPNATQVKQFIKRRGLIVASAIETEQARISAVTPGTIKGSLEKFKKLQRSKPLLMDRRRCGNWDEKPDGNRGEKLNRRMYAIKSQ
jgi:hypothetical protein